MDVGEIHLPPSLGFFITEGKRGPPQSLPHHHKYEGEMAVCVCLEECTEERKENRRRTM